MNVQRKNSNMETYIRSYDDILDEDICQSLIDKFEQSNSQYEIHDNVAMSFTQINLMKHNDWRIFYDDLNLSFKSCIERYKDDCQIVDNMFPRRFGYEQYRMKRYLPDGKDQFRNHVDVMDYNTARRFLVFFLYLNEPEGGETEFHCFNGEKIKPKAGRMCMFPPMWTHLHSGNAVMGTKPKYIIGSYLHYV